MGKTIWIAVGEYWGEQIRTRGTTERKALKAWRIAVSHKYQQTKPEQFDPDRKGQVMVLPDPNNRALSDGRILRGR
jgi:Ribbon-helix-helix domain